jgi:hypothetical protein
MAIDMQLEHPLLDKDNFDHIKEFVLRRGDRQTYCNMYNRNPHYRFGTFDVYLNPDIGQRNIDADPAVSGFDEMVIHDPSRTGRAYFAVSERTDSRRLVLRRELGATNGQDDETLVARYFEQMLAIVGRNG